MFSNEKDWTLDFITFNPEHEKNTETLCTTGNGYLGTRGAFEESVSSPNHSPGTYMAGVYNILVSKVGEKFIENEDFVNCPNWTAITFKINKEEWFDLTQGECIEYHKQLNFKNGLLCRKIRFKDNQGRITLMQSYRFVSMHDKHCAGIRYSLTPENYSGTLTIRSALDGDIINENVDRYKELESSHLDHVDHGINDANKGIYLSVKTNQSNITLSQAAKNSLYKNNKETQCERAYEKRNKYIAEFLNVAFNKGDTITLDKVVSLYTSHDEGVTDPQDMAQKANTEVKDFDRCFSWHKGEWESYWKHVDILVEGGEEVQKILRLHSYHLLVTGSLHNKNIDASIPARGLHGEAYRGHIFWDEMYIFPFYSMHFPEITRSLLLYRYRRLEKARQYAKEYGYKGAMYPWQSGSSGREETQIIHLNPVSGEWGDDYSALQRHVSLAVAYNVWMYYHFTEDRQFMVDYGTEMLCSIARFWVSKATFNENTKKYEIHHVMGPNEYHEKYPGADKGGLKDNTYTNVLTVWMLKKCLNCIEILTSHEYELVKTKLNLKDDEIVLWKKIISSINIVQSGDIISQFDGFLELQELDWEGYRKKYNDIARLDRILKAEGRSPDEYQLSKQADLLMLFYILPIEEVGNILRDLGIEFTSEILRKNYDYYLQRTSHGSTLSLIVHSRVAALFNDMQQSMEWFQKALTADISDIQGGTVKEGIHAGLMAGTIHIFLASFVGIHLFGNRVSFSPRIPDQWKKIQCNFIFKNHRYVLSVEKEKIDILVESDKKDPVSVRIFDAEYMIPIGKVTEINY